LRARFHRARSRYYDDFVSADLYAGNLDDARVAMHLAADQLEGMGYRNGIFDSRSYLQSLKQCAVSGTPNRSHDSSLSSADYVRLVAAEHYVVDYMLNFRFGCAFCHVDNHCCLLEIFAESESRDLRVAAFGVSADDC
jgi:hypothetical protein